MKQSLFHKSGIKPKPEVTAPRRRGADALASSYTAFIGGAGDKKSHIVHDTLYKPFLDQIKNFQGRHRAEYFGHGESGKIKISLMRERERE